ncbi:DUF6440 family protein [Oscillospiraceae bacterium 50-16]
MDRFQKIYTQGVLTTLEIWVDRETGVNYLWRHDGSAGGLTVLLDEDGKPVVTRQGVG